MDTKLLEDALILLEQQNLTAAAERRNMTQPAFSRRIQALERWVGQNLLKRHANRVEVSDELSQSEPQIRAVLAHLKQLQKHLQNPQQTDHTLVVAAPHSLSASAVGEVIEKANESDRQWRVRLLTRNQDEAISLFLRHEADLLVSYEYRSRPQMPFDDTVLRNVWRLDALVPVVGGKLRHLLRDDNILPEEVRTISYPAESMFGKIIDEHQAHRPTTLASRGIVESAFSVGVANLMKTGVGAAWVPQSLVMSEILSGDVVILSPDYGRIPMDIALYVHTSNVNASNFIQPLSQAS